MNKYGVKFSTIRYAQNQGKMLRAMTGFTPKSMWIPAERHPRQIALDAIMFAAITTPEQMRVVLSR